MRVLVKFNKNNQTIEEYKEGDGTESFNKELLNVAELAGISVVRVEQMFAQGNQYTGPCFIRRMRYLPGNETE